MSKPAFSNPNAGGSCVFWKFQQWNNPRDSFFLWGPRSFSFYIIILKS